MHCPACRQPVPEGARFCPACGQELGVTRTDERRLATVVFADLVGFTGLSEARDPEHVKHFVDGCFERLAADITSHGGRVDKIVGDAIIALFGAPVAHEDDAERAVRAALQMQRTLGTFSGERGVPVQLRVGVNTGEVLVGALRAGGDYTAVGDTVNVASRLQALAAPGQVVVGDTTRDLTDGQIRYEALGEVSIRGRDEPVVAWVATEAVGAPGQRSRSRPRSPLVGRHDEMAMLCGALSLAVRRRQCHLLVLTGDAGMGTSRLAEEVAHVAKEEYGADVFHGRAVPYGEGHAWSAIANAVRQACGIEPGDAGEVLASKVSSTVRHVLGPTAGGEEAARVTDGLLWLLRADATGEGADPARARDDAVRSILTVLTAASRERPVVLALAELHWADDSLLAVVTQLVEQLRNLPVVLIITGRPQLAERLGPGAGRSNAALVHLGPLEPDAARQLARHRLGEAPPELIEEVVDRAGGNPFFLEELAELARRPGRQPLPANLRSLIATRLDALPATERRLVTDAAVVGRMGTIDAITALAPDSLPVGPTLERLASEGLIDRDGTEWSFRSDLVREVAYDTVAKIDRARRHAALAAWMTDHVDTHEQLEVIAHHWATAAELAAELGGVDGVGPDVETTALGWLRRAAEQAERRDLALVAEGLWDRALGLLPAEMTADRRHARIRRALALAVSRRFEPARELVTEVLAEARADGDRPSEAQALTVLGRLQQIAGQLADSRATLVAAVEAHRAVNDTAGEADALRHQGMTELFAGDLDDGERSVLAALERFRQLGERRGEAWAHQNLAWISFSRGATTEADERLAESIRLFRETGDWGGLGWARGLLAYVRLGQGRIDEADDLGRAVLEERRQPEDRWATAMMTLLLAMTRLWRGRTEEAIDLSTEARRMFVSIGDGTGQLRALATQVRALTLAGRLAEADAAGEELQALSEREVEPATRDLARAIISAAAAVHRGDADRALAAANSLGEKRAWVGPDGPVARGLALLQAGRVEEALVELEATEAAFPEPGPLANVRSALALVRVVAGDPEGARAALDGIDFTVAGTYLDRTMASYAAAFAAVQEGDRAAALEAAADAVRVADATQDRLTRAITRLARFRVVEAVAADGLAETRADAERALSAVGIASTAWDAVFLRAAAPGS